jgi:UDP-N-acetyl-alpha-D-muramoyl-L-alanyl-L-glutamate epimerase
MTKFIFDSFGFDPATSEATFHYQTTEPAYTYTETIVLRQAGEYNEAVLGRALFLAFMLIGVSYYKTFPTTEVEVAYPLDDWQASFFTRVYQEGLSQFAFENGKTRTDLVQFIALPGDEPITATAYEGRGIVALQSGGKDSLLTAQLLTESGHDFTSLYITSGDSHPTVADEVGGELVTVRRKIDIRAIKEGIANGGLNGHVPVTYIVLSIGLLQAVLAGRNTLLASIGHEGEEPHAWIGDLPINHQWSKTWQAERLFAEYVERYISPDLHVGSLLRKYSELRIAELFAEHCWTKYGHKFSSCNRANYGQGTDNSTLSWCGDCPKCANSYLLFAPFVPADELRSIFGSQELFEKTSLSDTFKGLLGIDGVMKPFECIGEVDELRSAYHSALSRGFAPLPFDVPLSTFDRSQLYEEQAWISELEKGREE